ncbi:MAG: SDR family NAD(P)-dependent oxidoreductase [Chitinophagales bacterium]|nr:SDR family NAD(P)-dependent oxidoreductase [Chitinophagales bacterium]MDW8419835.1 SDR family NAD(P)-dependent oxidoreductase [Chitinophagales bacterium]
MTYTLTQKHPARRAFITGGGGGLGRALAVELAKDGWTVGITDINDTGLQESRALIEQAGGKALTYRFDVANRYEYEKSFSDFIAQAGGIDLLINNAGVGDGGLFGEYKLEHWEWITGINQMAVIYGTHFAVPHMKNQRSGHIISVASAAGIANMPNMSMYNVTKAAVISLMESIYAELWPYNVQVSVVCPTFFRSNIMQHHKGNEDAAKIGQTIIQRARFSPEDVARYILTQAGKNEFYILHPFQARFVFHLKRFMPEFFLRYKAKQFSKKDWVQKALSRRY